MALNVKAAIVLCAGFISGLCWLVSRVALPLAGMPFEAASVMAAATPAEVAAGSPALAGSPSFTHGNAFDSQAKANRSREGRVAVAPPPAAPANARPVVLPPMAQPAAADFVASDATRESPLTPEHAAPARPVATGAGDVRDVLMVDAKPSAVSDPPQLTTHTYMVKKGDTLARIAKERLGSSDGRCIDLLTAANPKLKGNPNLLRAGEEIIIPEPAVVDRVRRGEKPALALAADRPAPGKAAKGAKGAARTAATEKPTTPAPPKAAKTAKAAKAAPRVAAATDTSAPAARAKTSKTSKGQKIAKPVSTAKPAAVPATTKVDKPAANRAASAKSAETVKPRWVTIRPSDSLKSIAERYLNDGRRWRDIAQVNGLRQNDKVVAGQRIKLPETPAETRG